MKRKEKSAKNHPAASQTAAAESAPNEPVKVVTTPRYGEIRDSSGMHYR
jgi:hypothetical protein